MKKNFIEMQEKKKKNYPLVNFAFNCPRSSIFGSANNFSKIFCTHSSSSAGNKAMVILKFGVSANPVSILTVNSFEPCSNNADSKELSKSDETEFLNTFLHVVCLKHSKYLTIRAGLLRRLLQMRSSSYAVFGGSLGNILLTLVGVVEDFDDEDVVFFFSVLEMLLLFLLLHD